MYISRKESNGWHSVGRYGSNGVWVKRSLHRKKSKAEKQVNQLNKSHSSELFKKLIFLIIGIPFLIFFISIAAEFLVSLFRYVSNLLLA